MDSSRTSLPISVIIPTYNEERNLEALLRSIAGWVDEIFVVDSGSTDKTIAVAERYGAKIVYNPFETHVQQWSWALANLPLKHDWVLGLDADQRVTTALWRELEQLFTVDQAKLKDVEGFYISRLYIFRGHWMRYGGYYPKYLLKLFRRDRVSFDERDLLDHRFYVQGKVAKLQASIVEENHKENEIAFWIGKHNGYAVRHAREEWLRRQDEKGWEIQPNLFGSPDQRILWLKGLWYRLPLYTRPVLYFIYRYVVRRGILDGKQGFIFHFLQAFWYRLLVDINLDDLLSQSEDASAQNHK